MTMSLDEFNRLPDEQKKEVLVELKSSLGVSGIMRAWDVSRSKVYSMMKGFGIPQDSKKGPKAKPERPKISIEQSSSESAVDLSTKRKSANIKESSSLDFDDAEGNGFSLYLDTQGKAKAICQTLQMLLGSEQLSDVDVHISISVDAI